MRIDDPGHRAVGMTEDMSMHHRRSVLLAGAAAAMLGRPAFAQAWPSRPIRMIVAWPPGGAVDQAGRLFADALRERLGQPVVVENRGGAGGNIGTAAVAKAAPDGYTIGAVAINNLVINQFMYERMPYDPERELTLAALGWEAPLVLVVPAQHVPARTLAEFIAWARTQSGGVPFGSPGVGTTPHLSGALFCRRVGIEGTHVPFRGGNEALPALLRGDTKFAIDNLPTVISSIREGLLRALAVTSAERWPDLPDAPTMAESGANDFVVTSWGTIAVPAGTPAEIVERLSAAVRDAAADPAIRARFAPTGNRPLGSTPEQASARAARERPMWREAVQLSGARLE